MAKRTSYLELFFDLVFVFAITQVASVLHVDHAAGGWARTALLLWLVWWAWSQYTWTANAIDLARRPVQVVMLAVTACTLVAALALPEAFGALGLLFALPYAAVRLAALALYWFGLRGDPAHQVALRAYLPVAVVSPLLVLAGGLAPDGARGWVWLAAVVVDVASVLAAGRGEFQVAPAHFAERHALIVIIALGESVIAIGSTVMDLSIGSFEVIALTLAFGITAVLWWAYFARAAEVLEDVLVDEPDARTRGHLARDVFTLGHLPMVAGIVLFAVGVEEALVHPSSATPLFGRLAIGLGVMAFMAAFLVVARHGRGLPIAVRAITGVVVLIAALALAGTAGVVLLASVFAVLLAGAAVEWRAPVRAVA